MAGISVGEAVGAGFGLIRRRPGSVLVWGLAQATLLALSVATNLPLYTAIFRQMGHLGQGAAVAPSYLAGVTQYQALSNLLSFVTVFVDVVLNCAVFRAIVHPDRSRFWYLRVGVTELMLFALQIGFFIVFFIAFLVVMLPVGLIVGLSAAVSPIAAVVVGVLIGVASLGGWFYVSVRFSLMGPMMVDDGKIHFTDAWSATRGQAGSLFAIGLSIFALVVGLELVVLAVAAGLSFGMLQSVAGSAQAIPTFFNRNPLGLLMALSPVFLALIVLAIPIYGVVHALVSAPWARAYLDLRTNPADAF